MCIRDRYIPGPGQVMIINPDKLNTLISIGGFSL